jgi:hypothetical protein
MELEKMSVEELLARTSYEDFELLVEMASRLKEAEARGAGMVEVLEKAIARLSAYEDDDQNADLREALPLASPRAKQILAVVEQVRLLSDLMADPHPGLLTWNEAALKTVDRVCDAYRALK